MLEICSSNKNEVNISADADELRGLKRSVLALLDAEDENLVIDANQDFDPSPWDSIVSKIIIVRGNCPTKISFLNEKEIQIEGLPENLLRFVSFIDAAIESGSHAHYEYHEGNAWIAPESIPTVVSVK